MKTKEHDNIDKDLSEMITKAAYDNITSIGTFVFDSPIGDRIVKITVEPTDKELEDCPICLKVNCDPDCEAYEDGYI
jgi:hypothetical protein